MDFNSLGINIQKNINLIMKNVNIQRLSNNPITLDYNTIKRILLKKTNLTVICSIIERLISNFIRIKNEKENSNKMNYLTVEKIY